MNNIDTAEEVNDTAVYPAALLCTRQNYSLMQNRIMTALVSKLQPVILHQFEGLRSEHQPPFPRERLQDGYVNIALPMSLVMGVKKDYRSIRRALVNMCAEPILLPQGEGVCCRWVRVEHPMQVHFPSGCKNTQAMVSIHHKIADQLFSVSRGYFSFSRSTYLSCEHRSTQMLYLHSEEWSRKGEVTLSMSHVVWLVGCKHYRYFSDFRSKKLEVARAELERLFKQHKSTCYFTYCPIYKGSNVRCEPSAIHFFIHTIDKEVQANQVALRQKVATILRCSFKLTDIQAQKLAARVNEWNYPAVYGKIEELLYRLSRPNSIVNKRAYAYAVIQRVINEMDGNKPAELELPLAV